MPHKHQARRRASLRSKEQAPTPRPSVRAGLEALAQNVGKTNRLEHGWQTSVTSLHHDSRRLPPERYARAISFSSISCSVGSPAHGRKGTAGPTPSRLRHVQKSVYRDVRRSPTGSPRPNYCCLFRHRGDARSKPVRRPHWHLPGGRRPLVDDQGPADEARRIGLFRLAGCHYLCLTTAPLDRPVPTRATGLRREGLSVGVPLRQAL